MAVQALQKNYSARADAVNGELLQLKKVMQDLDERIRVIEKGSPYAMAVHPASQEGQLYYVDNTYLQAETAGLSYRNSQNLADKADDKGCATWGSVVYGASMGNDWLKVGAHYLPMKLQGIPVLTSKLYLVDNTQARHETKGLHFRVQKNLEAKHPEAGCVAPWGTIVTGEEDEGFLKCGNTWLPMELDQKPVIIKGASLYLIDNTIFQAKTHGLHFRLEKKLDNKSDAKHIAPWGSVVTGVDEKDGWLRVGQHFLPMKLNGVPVVKTFTGHSQQVPPPDRTSSTCFGFC